jgi:hypothetical protein
MEPSTSKIPAGALSTLSRTKRPSHLKAWGFLVLSLLPLPVYFAMLAFLLRIHAPRWLAAIAGFILIVLGIVLLVMSVAARSPFRKQWHVVFAFAGSQIAWLVSGKILFQYFGYLVQEMYK